MIDAFRKANLRQTRVTAEFRLPVAYQLVPADKIDKILKREGWWSEYYKEFPGSQGFLTLSRAGFSPDGTQALFYATNHCDGKCGTGAYVFMKKQPSGWAVAKEIIIWVS